MARTRATGSFALGLVALFIYGGLNLTHAYIHPRQMIPNSTQSYKAVNNNYRLSSFLVKTTSYFCSFKFSLLLVSYFCVKPQFKGDYSTLNWKQFNRFSLAYILLPYPIMMTACCYFLYSDGFFSYAAFSAIECIILSSISASLMLLDAVSAVKIVRKSERQNSLFDAQGNRIGLAQEYESDDELSRMKLRKQQMMRKGQF